MDALRLRQRDELPIACAQRAVLLDDARALPLHLAAADDRLAGRLEALLPDGPEALEALLDDGLPSARAAGLLAAHLGESGMARLGDAVASGSDAALASAIAEGVAWAARVEPALLLALGDSPAAMVARSAHGERIPPSALDRLATGDRVARMACARIVAEQGDGAAWTTVLADDADISVRCAALEAAAWCGEPWLRRRLRDQIDMRLLALRAALADADDALEVVARCDAPELGATQCALLADLGHPLAIERLLLLAEAAPSELTLAASTALTRVLGEDVGGSERWAPPVPPDDDIAAALCEPLPLPDAARARTIWAEVRERTPHATRFAQGLDSDDADPGMLDLPARRARELRRAAAGHRETTPAALARLTSRVRPNIADGADLVR